MIEIFTINGYDEIGRNCTAIRVDDEIIILDMGLHVENYIRYTEDEDVYNISAKKLIKAKAIPDLKVLDDLKDEVKAIIPTHAHLDHFGAIPFLSNKFKAKIICTPYTKEVIKKMVRDERIKLKNPIIPVLPNNSITVGNMVIEFIHITHSVPQAIMVAVHTKYGTVIYANDFKLDNYPTLGKRPNYKKLKKIGKEGVKALIIESLYADDEIKTPSESIAKEMLKDIMLNTDFKGKALIVTTFSSHLARLKSIIELGKKINRKIIFFGRSLEKYTKSGEKIGIVDFSKDVEIIKYRRDIEKKLRNIDKNKSRDKYVFVVTGHQGEKKAVLNRMAEEELPWRFFKDDAVIFSCKVIPSLINKEDRKVLEEKIIKYGTRIFKDVHVSGHASKEDLRDLIKMLNPEFIIPAHGPTSKRINVMRLAKEMGYKTKNIIMSHDGQKISLKE